MASLIELLKQIKKRPAMYLTRNYISCLKSFLDGWYDGREYNVPDADILGEFQDWIVNKYQITTSHGWCSIILFYHTDEGRALTAFFELFDEFLIEKQMEVL